MVLSPKLLILTILVAFVVIRSFTLLPSPEDDNGMRMHLARFRTSQGSSPSAVSPIIYQNQTFVFVHVGKTGGETIKWRLRVICNLRASKRKKAQCYEQFAQEESQLSKQTIGYMHCNALRPRLSIFNATSFLVSIRDPVDRVVSWFQYMHPSNCLPDRPSAACNLKKEDSIESWGHSFFHVCFNQVDDVIRSLQVPTSVNGTDCSALALDAVRGHGPEGPSNHLFFNYHFYANRSIIPHANKDVMVIRQEMIWEDLRRIEGLLGGNHRRPFETDGPIVTHGSELFPYKAKLSNTLIPNLCCAIENEITVYVDLIRRALNMAREEKVFSTNKLFRKCAADSLSTLSRNCHWNGKIV
jgi:hypothetical protein